MKKIKRLAERTFPGIYHSLRFSIGHPAHYNRVSDKVTNKYGKVVQEGPFKGMKYIDRAAGSAYIPKILGSYEMELHDLIEQIIRRQYSCIVDVGCAEGYYAVGLATRCPNSQIYAFDTDDNAQQLCCQLAQINGVMQKLRVSGLCSSETLNQLGSSDTLLLCDIEGAELDLIDLTRSPSLSQTDILVELHEQFSPGVTETLLGRLSPTHKATVVDATRRDPAQFPLVQFLSPKDRSLAVAESRMPNQQFAFFQRL